MKELGCLLMERKKELSIYSYSYLPKGEETPTVYIAPPCFGSIFPAHGKAKGIPFAYCLIQKHTKTKAQKMLLNYVLNRSPWASLYPYKSVAHLKVNGVVFSTNSFENLGAAIALREIAEFPHIADNFKTFVDAGVDEHFAYIASRYFRKEEWKELYCERFPSSHHCIGLQTERQVAELLSFKKDFVLESKADSVFGVCNSKFLDGGKYIFSDIPWNTEDSGWARVKTISLDNLIKKVLNVQKRVMI